MTSALGWWEVTVGGDVQCVVIPMLYGTFFFVAAVYGTFDGRENWYSEY
jgi:heme A synthase